MAELIQSVDSWPKATVAVVLVIAGTFIIVSFIRLLTRMM